MLPFQGCAPFWCIQAASWACNKLNICLDQYGCCEEAVWIGDQLLSSHAAPASATFQAHTVPSSTFQSFPPKVSPFSLGPFPCRHLIRYAEQEPLLLLACTVKGSTLAHMAAEAGRRSTLELLVSLVRRHAADLSARLQEVLAWSDSGADLLKNMRCAGHMLLQQPTSPPDI
jgi:hypothetical protein